MKVQRALWSVLAAVAMAAPTAVHADIYRFVDGSLIDDHLTLRSSYSIVKAAFSCAQIILQSQLPGKPTPHLYTLLSAFLKHIPTFEDPTPLLHSFHLKVLKHEGLLSISPTCTLCSLPALFLDTGECRCQSHASPSALSFTPSEWHTLT